MRLEDLLKRILDKPTMYIGNYSLENEGVHKRIRSMPV